MTWLKDGNLACDGCGEVHEFPGPRVIVMSSARAHGWHLFSGTTLAGKRVESHQCGTCMNSPRPRLPKVDVLEDQDPLF